MPEFTWAFWPPAPGAITGQFGEVGPEYPAGGHRGLDIGCPVGTLVRAPAGGTVVPFANDGSFGLGVCLDIPGTRWYVLLAHLSEVAVTVGEVVAAGAVVGRSGATGRVSGAHLHVQVCASAAFPVDSALSVDPLSFAAGSGTGGETASLASRVAALEAALSALNGALVGPRFGLVALALQPDIAVVERAAAMLRREGLL